MVLENYRRVQAFSETSDLSHQLTGRDTSMSVLKLFVGGVRSRTVVRTPVPTRFQKMSSSIKLLSNLYGRTKDLCQSAEDSVLGVDDVAELIISVVYERGPLCVVSQIFQEP